jgi:hypothetical protein
MMKIVRRSDGTLSRLSRPRRVALLTTLALASTLAMTVTSTPTASAAAPPGYGGPMSTCPGTLKYIYALENASGANLGGTLQVWYSSSNSGTFCAKTYDNLAGSHHMEVVIRRLDWQTNWYDSGTFTTYAGGVAVYGAATKCISVFGRVQVNGVNYEARDWPLPGPNATC